MKQGWLYTFAHNRFHFYKDGAPLCGCRNGGFDPFPPIPSKEHPKEEFCQKCSQLVREEAKQGGS